MKPIVILGPTASGKSDSAMAAAQVNGNTQIVVCDAMQVYKRMDIGTAKPTTEDQQLVQHHCIDLVAPSARFTVSDYQKDARAAVAKIHEAGANALVVAGTGLYLTSLIDELSFPGEWPAVRAELQREPDVAALYRHLKALDPVAAKNIERSNRRRIERALEVCIGSGKPFSDNAPGTGAYPDNGVVQIGLLWPRDVLVKRVESRVKAMLQRGFLEEVVQLRKDGAMSQTARQALGYAELNRHLDGRCTLDQAIGDIVIHTRQFAVRQERWFRRDPRIRWVHIEKDPVAEIAPILAEHLR
ncbi:MAG: tRNA (adenosine(37)-N6)-dimethylallyltransferase MiaA [Actinobacteria bacterium]|uniref:tRNA dimethylallyltransferase n=1 Tax=freshwater metagenome TaxID=449393 RepID=A0A6J7GL08_9ZZZZ|nr:tRNA (adenosine(37)-N6)-dimethylallyltransferase MiaA [Actinomycetota bacterium]